MKILLKTIISGIFIMLLSCSFTSTQSGKPIIREERKIVIDGIEEIWRLEWAGATSSECGPEDEGWISCPCTGFAFGESGDLSLVRKRSGQKEERLSLTPLFSYLDDSPGPARAVLRRWDIQETDYEDLEKPEFAKLVQNRPVARIMNFADYDHDGRSTEFILQIGTLPCGKQMSVVVGISKNNPRLHAFTSAINTKQPLILQAQQWESLPAAKGPVRTISWQCGDHGSEEEEEVELKAHNGKIHVIQATYACTETERGKLISQEDY